jgi:hypothetical protein
VEVPGESLGRSGGKGATDIKMKRLIGENIMQNKDLRKRAMMRGPIAPALGGSNLRPRITKKSKPIWHSMMNALNRDLHFLGTMLGTPYAPLGRH